MERIEPYKVELGDNDGHFKEPQAKSTGGVGGLRVEGDVELAI